MLPKGRRYHTSGAAVGAHGRHRCIAGDNETSQDESRLCGQKKYDISKYTLVDWNTFISLISILEDSCRCGKVENAVVKP